MLLYLDGWRKPPALAELAQRSWQVLQRRRPLLADLPPKMSDTADGTSDAWKRYWRENPVNAWVGGNARISPKAYFKTDNQSFEPTLILGMFPNSSNRMLTGTGSRPPWALAAFTSAW